MQGKFHTVILALSIGLFPVACKIERTQTSEEIAAKDPVFDPDGMVAEMWDSRVIPYLRARAGRFVSVRALELSDPNAAGSQYGHKAKAGNTPWTFVVKIDGVIVASNTASRAATIDVDENGDGSADLRIQIGPAIRGTALRDSLDFVSFNDFTNQIEYARFGKAFNVHAKTTFLASIPRDNLDGATVSALGAYQHGSSSALPLVTPAFLEIPAPQ